MDNARRLLTFLLLPLSILGMCAAVALADVDGGTQIAQQSASALPDLPTISMWTGLIVTAMSLAAGAVRALTASTSWAHTKWGAALIAFAAAFLAAGAEAIRTKGLHAAVLIPAATTALTSLMTMWNPTLTAQGRDQVSLAGAQVQPKQAGFIHMRMLTVLAILGLAGCATLYGQKFAACIEGKGISVAKGIPDQVNGILSSGDPKTTTVSALEGVAGTAAIDAVVCAVQAWLDSHQIPQNASPTPKLLLARSVGQQFLVKYAKHAAHAVCMPSFDVALAK